MTATTASTPSPRQGRQRRGRPGNRRRLDPGRHPGADLERQLAGRTRPRPPSGHLHRQRPAQGRLRLRPGQGRALRANPGDAGYALVGTDTTPDATAELQLHGHGRRHLRLLHRRLRQGRQRRGRTGNCRRLDPVYTEKPIGRFGAQLRDGSQASYAYTALTRSRKLQLWPDRAKRSSTPRQGGGGVGGIEPRSTPGPDTGDHVPDERRQLQRLHLPGWLRDERDRRHAAPPTPLKDGSKSDLAKVEVSIKQQSSGNYWDGSGFNNATETFVLAAGTDNWSYDFGTPAEGQYTIHSKATDNAGNAETSSVPRRSTRLASRSTRRSQTSRSTRRVYRTTRRQPRRSTSPSLQRVGNRLSDSDVTLSGTAGATTAVVTGSGTTYNVVSRG